MAEIGHQAKIPSLAEDWSLVEKDELPNHSNTFEQGTIKDNSTATASREISPEKIDQAPVVEKIVHTKGENVEESKVEEQPTKVEEKHVIENAPIVKDNSSIPEQKEEPQEVEQNEPLENSPTTEENNETPIQEEEQNEEGKEEAKEETPLIKIETAPADFRFPTTNQSRHCFTRYIEYHRCIAAKGEDAPECQKFAKYYRSLCPGEWIERWNEQRANGTFPGPL